MTARTLQYGQVSMTTKHSRRNFLRGQANGHGPSLMRPPGAQPDFTDLCEECGGCVRACPEGIAILHDRGGPVLDFTRGACTFCGECTRACGTGALSEESKSPWPWYATVTEGCLSLNGISCRACEDACDPRAIRFRLMTGGRAVPVIDEELCTGCGVCAYTCPAGAVAFEKAEPMTMEASS